MNNYVKREEMKIQSGYNLIRSERSNIEKMEESVHRIRMEKACLMLINQHKVSERDMRVCECSRKQCLEWHIILIKVARASNPSLCSSFSSLCFFSCTGHAGGEENRGHSKGGGGGKKAYGHSAEEYVLPAGTTKRLGKPGCRGGQDEG